MSIRLGPRAWNQLHLDEQPENLDLIRSCFYLGYNVLKIADIIESAGNESERLDIIRTATILGMTDEDMVIYDETTFP